MNRPFRKTSQAVAPAIHSARDGAYNIYPGYPIGAGGIELGFDALAARIVTHPHVIIDGMGGILWDDFRTRLQPALARLGVSYEWFDITGALKSEHEVDQMLDPYLGGDDPLFGTRNPRTLEDFFVVEKLTSLASRFGVSKRVVVYGTGSALVLRYARFEVHSPLFAYVDLPKNEIQFRSRAGSITNVGAFSSGDPKAMYKRFYFADWPALRTHQAEFLPRLDLIVDAQRPDEPATMSGSDLRAALSKIARSWCRVRPWFEPGPWGGQWMKKHFAGLPQDVPNLAWSFELISPENGLALESSGRLLEVSCDFLLAQEHRAVLGDFAERFGPEFPIRFDYLDTFDGGNLSVQCHPRPDYAWRNFGERFTQDETYYLTDCAAGAQVYLGFQDGIDPAEFRRALQTSLRDATPLEVGRFVQTQPSQKHGLYLIPNGTIHCSGANNLVLEISATPYIFTFKMYDWMRLDLDGRPRPLNIDRAMENLYFDRQGERVARDFIARPQILARGEDWQVVHLPTHLEHFYDVHRLDFATSIECRCDGSPHVLNVVEGGPVILETADASPQTFAFGETFIIPAATDSYRLTTTAQETKVVKAFLKPDAKRIPEYLCC